MPKRPTLVVVSQTYPPDPAAVGQYMHEAGAAMAAKGWRVVAYASARGYDDPGQKYPAREVRDGVEVRRLPLSSFGKGSIKVRLIGGFLFCLQAAIRALLLRRIDRVLVSTSPPMAPITAIILKVLRRSPFCFWAMDINPDQMIAMGLTTPTSKPAKLFETMIRATLNRAESVLTLDRYMGAALEKKVDLQDRLFVAPPWPMDNRLQPVDHQDNPFRAEHGLQDKFVVMYSGNLSPAHPLDTLLDAALRLKDDDRFRFVFIGGGGGREKVDAFQARHHLPGLITLPYQPLDQIRYSLSAADLHVVAMGDAMVGVVHPCKVYGAMLAARPILGLGPAGCHIGEIAQAHGLGWRADHGDVDGLVRCLHEAYDA
ncbi:MAG: glycosyltransferase family 4 protein, partial [Planctomycetota bacterium]